MSLNTTPATWTTTQVVTALQLNTEIRDALTGVQAAWTTYAPTVTGITKGNGTEIARWSRVGHSIDLFYQFTFGSTSAMTTGQTVTLPVAALNSTNQCGDGVCVDFSATAFWDVKPISTSTTLVAFRIAAATANAAMVGMTSALPFTWATSDVFQFSMRYEAA